MVPNSTSSPAGSLGFTRGSQNSSTMLTAPIANDTQLASGSWLMIPRNFSTVLPSGFSTPKSLFSWPTATNTARPITKPSMTGLDRNWVMKPRRRIPATRKTRPVTSTNAAALAT